MLMTMRYCTYYTADRPAPRLLETGYGTLVALAATLGRLHLSQPHHGEVYGITPPSSESLRGPINAHAIILQRDQRRLHKHHMHDTAHAATPWPPLSFLL